MGDFNGSNYKDRFIADLVDFVAGDTFQSMFETFFVANAMEFTFEEEHKLKYHEIYLRFQTMFEKQLEEFCRRKDMTQGEFMRYCREATVEDPKAKHYINILLSSVEYDTFVKLMKIMRPVAELRLKANAKASADSASLADSKSLVSSGPSSPAKSSSKLDQDDSSDAKATEMDSSDTKASYDSKESK